jgi:Rps23 Pro-64 3,4-dihydroxylase Tpa1-like proline 4-hydroxylase
MAAPSPFALADGIHVERLAEAYAATGRVTIEPFLAPGRAERLLALLRESTEWRRVLNSGDKLFELDRDTQQNLSDEQRASLELAVYGRARHEFQFRYETIRTPDEESARRDRDDGLCRFASWLSCGPARDVLRMITGDPRIAFADAQATAYGPGDFLTEHTDEVEGKGRVAAYVLGLSPEWRMSWGGLFLMHSPDGARAEALAPGFNRLNLFRVPQLHSVSEVTRAVPYRRYSITGWLRRETGRQAATEGSALER